jgi:hypothetical protein
MSAGSRPYSFCVNAASTACAAGERSATVGLLRLGLGLLPKKLHHQAVGFTGIGNELASVVEAFFVEADDFFRWRRT